MASRYMLSMDSISLHNMSSFVAFSHTTHILNATLTVTRQSDRYAPRVQ
jgi:hypothetical protein